MGFTGFDPGDFATFRIDGLEPRMEAIRSRIGPKFQAIGEALAPELSALSGAEMHVHIAKHARRKTNAPKDTWLAFSANKRGYKQHPHFQIGLFDDHLFLWFALIYELPDKERIATAYLKQPRKTKNMIPDDCVLSFDHTEKASVPASALSEKDWKTALQRLRDVKSCELLIGRHLTPDHPLVADGPAFLAFAGETFAALMPLYRMAADR